MPDQDPNQTFPPADARVIKTPDGRIYAGYLRRDDDGRPRVEMATCGTCGFQWNDALVTSITPVPAGRTPCEYSHAPELTDCRECGARINPALGALPPTGDSAAGTEEDPRAPGDWDDICDLCNYGELS